MKIINKVNTMELKEFSTNRTTLRKRFYRHVLENSALRYLNQMGSLFDKGSFGGQKEFWEWQAKEARPVKCVSYREIPDLKERVEEFLKRNELIVKECYHNSMKIVWDIPDVEYVEGIANLIIPLDHAWNYYKGHYFDLTAEVVLGKNVERFEYAQVIRLQRREMDKYALKTGLAGGYIPEYYMDKVVKK